MQDNHVSAGTPPWTPLGSTQRSTDHLAGGEEACCPVSKNPSKILELWAWLTQPPFFSGTSQFRFSKYFISLYVYVLLVYSFFHLLALSQ